MPDVGVALLQAPFSEMVLKLALAIAEGQTKLDMNSTEVAKFMCSEDAMITLPNITTPYVPAVVAPNGTITTAAQAAVLGQGIVLPLIALGFFPGFYQFTEAIIEVKMAITMSQSSDFSLGVKAKAGIGCFAASVNASYSSKYSYNVEGSSLLRIKLAPVPPPQILQDYMEVFIHGMTGK